jgi:hypothetical protein
MATMAAAAVLPENHGDNKAIRAIRMELRGQLFEKIRAIRMELRGQLFEKIRPMNRNPMEILPHFQTSLDLQLLRNPEIDRGDLVERLQTVIVTVSMFLFLLVFP